MHNQELITHFYNSFDRGDAEIMAGIYHDDVIFNDPAFGQLKGEEVRNMWRMLISRSRGDMKITLKTVKADEHKGNAEWTAEYTFGPDSRKVLNSIKAEFEFKDGKIISHTDHFDLWGWSKQALGWKGHLFGWSSFLQKGIQKKTQSLLKAFIEKGAS